MGRILLVIDQISTPGLGASEKDGMGRMGKGTMAWSKGAINRRASESSPVRLWGMQD